MTPRPPRHLPVLPAEALALLAPAAGELWVDATAGLGGHTRLLAERVGPTGKVIALDQDAAMLALAKAETPPELPVVWVNANFEQLEGALARLGIKQVDGLLADLGVCSAQLDDPARGLSFQQDGPLDMRLDPTVGESAADLLNRLGERELADILWRYGGERHSRRIARRVVEQRRTQPFATTGPFADLVRRCVPRGKQRIDPATRAFQGLRIAVNDELGALERLLEQLPRVVKPGGRVGIISFHSLEDRPVKQALRDRDRWEPLTKKPVQAGEDETRSNPRSRSAKLRAARRTADDGREHDTDA
jgi:16S rRNA (cytosine1402-N4)-methyltransferase